MIEWIVNILGWVGSVAVVLAYGLNSYQKIKSNSWAFLIMNITGGIFLTVYTIYKEAYANTFINVVWVIIAIPALIKLFSKTRT